MIRQPALLALSVGFAASAAAQQPSLPITTAVTPDTVTVGDPFTSVVRVQAPPGSIVEFHGVVAGDSVQAVDTVRVIAAASDSGATAAYRLVAWVAGVPLSAAALVRVTYPGGGTGSYDMPLALPIVASVLPAGGEDLEPRPSRGVIPLPAAPAWWPWALGSGLVALALAFWLWWSARRGRSTAELTRGDARAAALGALRVLEESGWEADPARVHDVAAAILRRYLADLDPGWGREWTSSEVVPRVGERAAGGEGAATLAALLAEADAVKFAGLRPPAGEAAAYLAAVRHWIVTFPAEPVGVADPREAA